MSGYVPEEPITLGPGVAELLADPAHYRKTPTDVVDYGPATDEVDRFQPLRSESRWSRLRARLRRRR